KELDVSDKGKQEIGFGRYLRRGTYLHERGVRPRIAVVFGNGPENPAQHPPRREFFLGEKPPVEKKRPARDEHNRAIVLRINSPGGSGVGSDLVWRDVREAQERGKPVIVSMGEVAGSGGYYVAMGADSIVAEPATITGSIGVVYMKLDLS